MPGDGSDDIDLDAPKVYEPIESYDQLSERLNMFQAQSVRRNETPFSRETRVAASYIVLDGGPSPCSPVEREICSVANIGDM